MEQEIVPCFGQGKRRSIVTTSDGTVVGNANGKYVTDSAGAFLIDNLDPGVTLVVKEIHRFFR